MIEELEKPTPQKNVISWIITTILYAFVIIVNEQFDLIESIGLSDHVEAVIRVIGAFLYIILTTLNFSKTK